MREVEFVREPIRRRPESRADQRRYEIRKLVAVTVLMRQGLTRLEAEEQFNEFGVEARKRRYRR